MVSDCRNTYALLYRPLIGVLRCGAQTHGALRGCSRAWRRAASTSSRPCACARARPTRSRPPATRRPSSPTPCSARAPFEAAPACTPLVMGPSGCFEALVPRSNTPAHRVFSSSANSAGQRCLHAAAPCAGHHFSHAPPLLACSPCAATFGMPAASCEAVWPCTSCRDMRVGELTSFMFFCGVACSFT